MPGLWLDRSSTPTDATAVVYAPSLCVVAQGAKAVLLGGEAYRYDPAQPLLVSVDMPASTRIAEASANCPCLAFRLPIAPAVVAELLADGTATPPHGPPVRGIGSSTPSRRSSTPSVDCSPCSTPHEIAALAPLVLIHDPFRSDYATVEIVGLVFRRSSEIHLDFTANSELSRVYSVLDRISAPLRADLGTWDCKHLLSVFAVVNWIRAAVHGKL